MSPEKETAQPLWEASSSALSPSQALDLFFTHPLAELNTFQLLSHINSSSTTFCLPALAFLEGTLPSMTVFLPCLCACNDITASVIKSRKAKVAPLLPIPFLINFSLLYLAYCPGVHPDSSRGDSARAYFHNSSPRAYGA